MKKWIVLVILLGVGGALGARYWYGANNHATSFRTAPAERGNLLATINATGTIEPEEVIDVGAQVQGQILNFGRDPRNNGKAIDYGSPVEKDTILAQIDAKIYQALVDQNEANVDQAQGALEQIYAQLAEAKANILHAEADLERLKALLYQSERDWARAQKLGPQKAITELDFDTTEATAKTAKANLGVGEATLAQNQAALLEAQANVTKAKATLASAKAALNNAKINLSYCTIQSPVKGVIVDRRVSIGQTVVSSLNAPSLFLIAKDLKRLQVWSSVNEADIGNIRPGQPVTFTVDAFPDRVFKGTVAPDQPRLNATMTQNVVTYTVVVNTDNSDGKLLPYLTTNLQFEVNKHVGVLLVPNAALRWKPNPKVVAPEARGEFLRAQQLRKGTPDQKAAPAPEKERHDKGMVWVEDNGFVKPIKVRYGLSDGVNTEILAGELQEGMTVVVGENRADGGEGTATNPFTPQMFGNKK